MAELAADRAHLAAVEALDPAGLSATRPLRARPGAAQRPPGDPGHRRHPHLGAPLAGPRHGRRRPVPVVRPRLRPAGRAPGDHRRPARGGGRLPGQRQVPGDRAPGPALAGHRDRGRRRAARLHRRDPGRRRAARGRRPGLRRGRAPPAAAGRRRGTGGHRAVRHVPRGPPARRHRRRGRSAASATTRWSPTGPSTASMPTPSWPSAGSSSPGRRPRASTSPARSTRARPRPRSSIASSPISRSTSRPPWRRTATRCAGRVPSSSSATS